MRKRGKCKKITNVLNDIIIHCLQTAYNGLFSTFAYKKINQKKFEKTRLRI